MPDAILQEVEALEVVSRKQANEADELVARQDFVAATRVFQELVKNRPDLARPRINLSSILMAQGKMAPARDLLLETVERFPTDPMAHLALAGALEATG